MMHSVSDMTLIGMSECWMSFYIIIWHPFLAHKNKHLSMELAK